MNVKQILGALAFVAVMSVAAAQAADAPAAGTAMKAAPAATEKCETTKDGKTTTADVAVGTCEKSGGKVVADDKKAGDAMAPAEKK